MRRLCQGRKKCLAMMLISQAWLDILIHKEEGFSAFFPGCLGSFPRIWVLGKDKDFVGEYGATGGEHPAGPSRRGAAAPAKVLLAAWLAGGESCALRLTCSNRSRLWLDYGENIELSKTKTKHDLDQQIFEGENLYLALKKAIKNVFKVTTKG